MSSAPKTQVHNWLVALIVLGVALLLRAFWVDRIAAPASTAPVRSSAPALDPVETNRLSGELATLSAEVRELRARVRRVEDDATARAAASETGGQQAQPNEQEREELREAYLADIEAAFMEEHVDRAWAATTSATVQAQLAEQPGLTEALRSLECRARRCRVELDEEATKPIAAALPALALQLGAVLPNAEFDRLDEGAGKTRHVIYFAR